MSQEQVYKVVFAAEAQQFQQRLESLKRSWGVFTAAIEQTQGALWNATVLGFQMSIAGRNWAENLFEIANQSDEIRLKLESFEQAVRTSGESLDEGTLAVQRLAEKFQILPDQVANAVGLLLRKGFKIKDAIVILERFADAAVNVGRDIADGLEAGASALLQERSILLNSVGIAENISTAYNQYAKALHKSVQALTEAEKRQALMNLVMQSTANRVGLAEKYLAGFRGQVQRLSKEWRLFVSDFGKGIAAAFAPFITGARVVLQLLNAMPKEIRILLGVMSTLGSLSVFLGGVLFLTVSNVLRFVTTVKKTLADTIKSLQLAILAYRESNAVIAQLGLSSAATAKHLDALSLSLLSSAAAASSPAFAHFIENLSLIATDGGLARKAVIGLADDLRKAFEATAVTDVARFDVLKRQLDAVGSSLSKDLVAFRGFEATLIGALRKLSGKRVDLDKLIQIKPKTIENLREVGLEVSRASKILTLSEAAVSGRQAFSDKQLKVLKESLKEVQAAYLGLASATSASAISIGIDTTRLSSSAKKAETILDGLIAGVHKRFLVQRVTADDIVDYNGIIKRTEQAFAKAGLQASIVFSSNLKSALEAGQFVSGKEFAAGIKAIEAWPKGLDKAAASARLFRIEGKELNRAVSAIALTVSQTSDSYKIAMTNMSLITRSAVTGMIGLLQKLRLHTAALAVSDFIASIAPTKLARIIDGAGPEALKAASRLGREAGTSFAFALTSSLQYVDVVFASVLNKLKIGKLGVNIRIFGNEANRAFRYFTRGADDAAVAAIALTESTTALGKFLRYLNNIQTASASKLTLLQKIMKVLSVVVLELSNVFGFFIRAVTALITTVPIVGWFLALLAVSEKFRTAMGSLLGSIVSALVSLVSALTTIVGAFGTFIQTAMDFTGASTLIKVAVDGLVTVIEFVALGFRQLANGIKYAALSSRKWLLNLRLSFVEFASKVPVIGRYFRVDERALRTELKKIGDELDRTLGRVQSEQERYAQKMIDVWGPRWSDELRDEFNAAKDSFKGLEETFNDLINNSKITSIDALKGIEAYIEYYTDLLDRLKKGGAQTKDIAFVQEMISRFTKLKQAVSETADAVKEFMTSLSDKSVEIDIELTPSALKPFKELEQEMNKLRRTAEEKFKGADLSLVNTKILELELRKRNLLVAKYNEEFAKLFEDNEARIEGIVAKGIEDELEQLRYERKNAIRETERRFDEQLKKYAFGSAEYAKLVAQKHREIEALNNYYALRERQLLEENLRKDRELRLRHYEEVLQLIAENNRKALDLWQQQNEGLFAAFDEQLAKEKELIERRRILGLMSAQDAALAIAEAERRVLEKRMAHEEALAKARKNNAIETANSLLQVELRRLELERQKQIENINETVKDEQRKAKLIADTDTYFAELADQKRKSAAYDVYLAESELQNKLSDLRRSLVKKDIEIERIMVEKQKALYDGLAEAASKSLSEAMDTDDISKLAGAVTKAESVIRILGSSGDEAASAYKKLAESLKEAREQLKSLVYDAIDEANAKLSEMQGVVNGWNADPVADSLNSIAEFGSKFGKSLDSLKAVMSDISKLPEDIRATAVGAIKPFIDDIGKISKGIDELREKRDSLQKAIESGQLSFIDERKAREEVDIIDSYIKKYVDKVSSYINNSIDGMKNAIADVFAQRNIDAAKSEKELEGLEADLAAARMRLAGEAAKAEIETARERLSAAREYYDTVKKNAGDLLDKEKARREIASAALDVLNAELDLRNLLKKQREDEIQAELDLINLSRAKLELEQAAISASLKRSGLAEDLADTYSQILIASRQIENIDKEISIAKRTGDERKVIELQKQRIDLETQYLNNIDSANKALQGMVENLASSISPSEDLLASMYALSRASESLGVNVSDVIATGFSAWIDSATSMADRLRDLESMMYDSDIVAKNYAARIADISDSAYGVVDSMLAFGDSTSKVTDAMLKSVDASKRVSNFYDQLASGAEDVANSISSLFNELNSEDVNKIFKNLNIDTIDVGGIYDAAKSISDAVDTALFFDTDATSEQRKKIVDFFSGMESDFKDAERRLRKVLVSDVYDPQVVSRAVDEYKRLGQEIAGRTSLSLRDVLDTGLLRSVGSKLNDDAKQFRAKARRAALQASAVFDEYMDMVEKKAKEMGTSTDKLIDVIKTINMSINPFANVDAQGISSISSVIQKGIDGIVNSAAKVPESVTKLSSLVSGELLAAANRITSVVSGSISSINMLVETSLMAISRLIDELSRLRATRVDIDVSARTSEQVIMPKVDTSFVSDSVSQAVTDAIRRAAESMAIEPKVFFNGEITEAPSLSEIADDIMPKVLSAMREELERRKAIGVVNQAGSVC